MKPRLSHGLLSLLVAVLPHASADEFAAAEVSASRHGLDVLAATSAAITEADLQRHVTRLASEEYEGRGTAGRGGRMATAYLATFFEGLGLQAGGDRGAFYQEFKFPGGMQLCGKNRLSLRIDEPVGLVRRFQPGEHYQPLPISSGGRIEGGVVFAGFGIDSGNYNSFEGPGVEGKWLVVLRGSPEGREDLARFGSVMAKVKIAKKKGAAGVILIKGTNPAIPNELIAPDASVGGREQILPAITISDRLAAAMITGTEREEELKNLFEAYHQGDRVTGFRLPYQLEAEIGIETKEDTGRNVLARLQAGSEPSAEVVVVGAHIDHLGRGDRGGSRAKGDAAAGIHFGADDNASGVAVMMELAQLLADQKKAGELGIRRDIVFAAWSGEEMGLRGSKFFLENAKAEMDPLHPAIAAYLNMDMVGRITDKGLGIHGTASSKAWGGILDAVASVEGLEVNRSESPYVPSDSVSFYNAGIPVLAAFTGLHDDFHTPGDTVDKIDFVGLGRVSRYMRNLTVIVADAPGAPDYVKVPRGGKREATPKVHLGLRLDSNKGGGVLLAEVVPDSASARAGLRAGDVLVNLDGRELNDAEGLLEVIKTLKAGQQYKAVVKREGNALDVTLVPEPR